MKFECIIEVTLEEIRFLSGVDWEELKPQFSNVNPEVLFSLLEKGFIREHRGDELILTITELGKLLLERIGL